MSELDSKEDVRGSNPPAAAPQFAAANSPSYAHTLFFGAHGLRPGWGLLFYLILFIALQHVFSALAWIHNFGFSGLWSMLLEALGNFAAASLPAVVLARVEHRRWSSYGLPERGAFGRLFWIGGLWGFAGISLLMMALYEFHVFSFGHLALHGVRLLRFALFWGAMFLLVGLFEEFLLRGYMQFTLGRGIGFWPAAITLSCVFGLSHLGNEGEHFTGLLAAAAIGFFLCLTLRRTGTLWFAVGFHAAWDWGESYFYSVPDSGLVSPGHLLSSSLRGSAWLSGGSVGPEGSLLCFVVIGIVALIFERIHHPAIESGARPSGKSMYV